MKTIKAVSKIAGISVRTLQYYDKIGLLHPTDYSDVGYRLYSDNDLITLQHILLFKELEFPLNEIKEIINSDNFDRDIALEQQIKLLTLKKEHLENLILFAKGVKLLGVDYMNFSAFDTKKIDEYAKQAKESWGHTNEFKEFEEKQKNRSTEETKTVNQQLMMIFAEFGKVKSENHDAEVVQALVKKLQNYISDNFYRCSNEILSGLGKMYAGGGDFTKNIDEFAGEGTAVFVNKAIEYYCK
ncbi:TPA: MerR family transcriptional regulator [Streptococcus agalactiae]|uniref:MerR family transcriptional regulator n=1 Tax=Anaerococcus faecalis TaxID=2742993 RepID=A0ABX2NAI1_9FIRM|nr:MULTISPECIES: MerR family transcriptional regulator [Bacillota]MDU0945406.1 MerR family transcriptional regulator [Anaerococcus vaginalis]KAA8973593.1 MerR family transcriptional regulator [Streptococcus agalactiae]KAA8975019.1 MerR family transcriptional regulator [Streptococcus agalactiae]KAA9093230.1 MerR family transcriptional regulator [Streptococcus agalactiae]KAA9096516.1 MerR family transcriptional regulator [Streptococcus agalactiae]